MIPLLQVYCQARRARFKLDIRASFLHNTWMVEVVSRNPITDYNGHAGELVTLDDGASFNSWLTKEYQDSNGNPVVLTKGQGVRVFDGTDPTLFSNQCTFHDDSKVITVGKPSTGGVLIEGEIISLRDGFVHVVDNRDPNPDNHKYSTLYPSSDKFEPITL